MPCILIFLRISYIQETIFTSFLSSPIFPQLFLKIMASFTLLLLHIGTYASTHTCMCIHKSNLLSLVNVTYICLCLGMSTWDQITCHLSEAHPRRKLILHFSAAIKGLELLLWGVGPYENSPMCTGMLTYVIGSTTCAASHNWLSHLPRPTIGKWHDVFSAVSTATAVWEVDQCSPTFRSSRPTFIREVRTCSGPRFS